MSVKLYDGLRVIGDDNIFSVVEKTSSLITQKFRENSLREVATEFARVIDNLDDDRDGFRSRVILEAEDRFLSKMDTMNSTDALHDPLRFSIVFGRSQTGRILAYPFCLSDTVYRQALIDSGIFQDYHYQNQTDYPEEISEREWYERENEWMSILDDNDSFSSLPSWELGGSIIRVFSQFMFGLVDIESIDLNNYISRRYRAKEKSHKILMQEGIKNLDKSGEQYIDHFLNLSGRIRDRIDTVMDTISDDHPLLPPPLPDLYASFDDVQDHEGFSTEMVLDIFGSDIIE